jgi:hypothetical protein
MITYAERKAEHERLSELFPHPPHQATNWTLEELRFMERERYALEYLGHYGTLPDREEAK